MRTCSQFSEKKKTVRENKHGHNQPDHLGEVQFCRRVVQDKVPQVVSLVSPQWAGRAGRQLQEAFILRK